MDPVATITNLADNAFSPKALSPPRRGLGLGHGVCDATPRQSRRDRLKRTIAVPVPARSSP